MRRVWLSIIVLLVPVVAGAMPCRLEWTYPTAVAIDGFRIHSGMAPKVYTTQVDIPVPTPRSATITHRRACQLGEFLVVTAFKVGHMESKPSNEVQIGQLPTPSNLKAIIEPPVP